MKQNSIVISRLKTPVFIGVPEEERSCAQTVEIDIELIPTKSLLETEDKIENTINYYDVSLRVLSLSAERPRKLLETLNEEILKMLLDTYDVEQASCTIYKFILPNTQHVQVNMSLSRNPGLPQSK